MRPKLFASLFFIAVGGLFPTTVTAAPDEIDIVRESGQISGQAQFCGLQGSEGIEVGVAGKSLWARTDPDGKFTISYHPIGTWNLQFRRDGRILGVKNGVPVIKRALTDIGVFVLCADSDGDGFTPDVDCDDTNNSVYPGANDICGDGLDNNCNGETDETCPTCTDTDADGFYAQAFCGFPDCDDSDPSRNPGAQESCGDGIDNDCDGQIDEADALNAQTFYRDADGDGYGDTADTLTACAPSEGYVDVGGDCDDARVASYPGATELCSDGLDTDCDGIALETEGDCSDQLCTETEVDAVQFCMEECTDNVSTCAAQCIALVSEECGTALQALGVCSIQARCDEFGGGYDQSAMICTYDACPDLWVDVYGDLVPSECTNGETVPCGTDQGECATGSYTCSDGRWSDVCVGGVDPAAETCDELDNDCDNLIDEDDVCGVSDVDGDGIPDSEDCAPDESSLPRLFYVDADNDGYGNANGVQILACLTELGASDNAADCDDADPGTNPGAPEICGDLIDNDCNGIFDDPEQCGFCGDGVVNLVMGEQCDDGNTDNFDDCPNDCRF